MSTDIGASRLAVRERFGGGGAVRIVSACVAVLSLSITTIAPAFAVSSSISAPALAGLPAAPAPALETSGEGSADVSPYDQNNAGAATMSALSAAPEEQQSAKFEPPETPYNGAFTRSLAIEAPPFFDLTPNIRLNYNSGDNRQHSGDGFSLLGVGWTMSGGGLIERKSARGGLPRFDAADVFELEGTTLLDCVVDGVARATPSCGAGGTHTGRYETYERIVRNTSLNTWQVTARDGTVSLYQPLAFFSPSGSEDARLRNDYRWLLASRTDTDGNVVSYSYDCAALPTCYVTAITYGTATIQFFWETRTDTFTHATGISLASVTKRLKTIGVKAGANLVRAYALGYTISLDTRRSLLSSIRQHGADATVNATSGAISGGTSLPANSFTYWQMTSRRMGAMISDLVTANTAAETTPSTTATEAARGTLQTALGDFNRDGRIDSVETINVSEDGPCNITFRINQKDGTAQDSIHDPLGLFPLLKCEWAQKRDIVGDFNGDGYDDLAFVAIVEQGAISAAHRQELSTAGFGDRDLFIAVAYMVGTTVVGSTVVGVDPSGSSTSNRPFLVADFTGDGMDDIYHYAVFRATGAGFIRENWSNEEFGRIGDFNADGLADLIVLDGANGIDSRLHISTGSAFELHPIGEELTSRGDYPWPEFETNKHNSGLGEWYFADFTGDGTTDFLHSIGNSSSLYEYLSTGTDVAKNLLTTDFSSYVGPGNFNDDGRADIVRDGFSIRVRSGASFVKMCEDGNSPGSGIDGDGDGKGNFSICSRDVSDGSTNIWYDALVPDLLKRHTLSSGGTVDVEYLPSTYWPNGYLPMVMQAVSKVTTADGLGNSAKTKYAYEGGAYDPFERRFLGFAKVTAELPCEADETTCPWVHAWYRQEAVAAGSLSKLEVYSPDGKLRRKLENGYVVNQATAPFTAHKTSEQVTDYLGANATDTVVTRKDDR